VLIETLDKTYKTPLTYNWNITLRARVDAGPACPRRLRRLEIPVTGDPRLLQFGLKFLF
jgi:hypothetical protein